MSDVMLHFAMTERTNHHLFGAANELAELQTQRRSQREAVTVRLRHSKIHAADCADCETKEGMLDRIESDLEFAGRLTQEQRSKLLEIAERCPVHRTLVSEIDIRSRVL
jgi:uncharacterized OsmC-like protein